MYDLFQELIFLETRKHSFGGFGFGWQCVCVCPVGFGVLSSVSLALAFVRFGRLMVGFGFACSCE